MLSSSKLFESCELNFGAYFLVQTLIISCNQMMFIIRAI